MLQKIIRVGRSSLAVIIPAVFVHSLGIKAGDQVQVQSNMEKGSVILKFSGVVQLRLPAPTKTGSQSKQK